MVSVALEFAGNDKLFRVSISWILVMPAEVRFVMAIARPALPAVEPLLPLYTNRQTDDAPDKTTLALYTNFLIPGIENDGFVHCVSAKSAVHTGVISTPAEGGKA